MVTPVAETDQGSSLARSLERFRQGTKVPAVGAAVVTRDALESLAVAGALHADTSEPATREDRWHIGSCTKMFTAALYARAVESGRTHWDRPVTELFPDLGASMHPGWARSTARALLRCVGGMPANLGPRQMLEAWRDERPLVEQRSAVVERVLARPPSRIGRFRYSNLSYVAIGAAIDRLSGGSWEQALEDQLLRPLGVTSFGFGAPPRIPGHPARLRVGPYHLFRGAPIPPEDPRSDNPAVLSSAGTLHLGMADWARATRLFLEDGPRLLSPSTIDTLLQPTDPTAPSMAMGWLPLPEFANVSLGFQGSNTMWSATVVMDRHRSRAALVACNDGRSSVLLRSARLAADMLG